MINRSIHLDSSFSRGGQKKASAKIELAYLLVPPALIAKGQRHVKNESFFYFRAIRGGESGEFAVPQRLLRSTP
jgi:hypothetical protein